MPIGNLAVAVSAAAVQAAKTVDGAHHWHPRPHPDRPDAEWQLIRRWRMPEMDGERAEPSQPQRLARSQGTPPDRGTVERFTAAVGLERGARLSNMGIGRGGGSGYS